MELFVRKLMACRSADNATVEVLMELLRIRRERCFSAEQLKAFVRDASETISKGWPESAHKSTILACLAKLAEREPLSCE